MRESYVLAATWALGLVLSSNGASGAPVDGVADPSRPSYPTVPPIPAPTNLVFDTDAASCERFRIGAAPTANDPCRDLATRSRSGTFHWDWPGKSPYPVWPENFWGVFGFLLYRVDAGHRAVAIGNTNRTVDGNAFILLGSVFPRACYAVSAYSVIGESPLSPELCLGEHLEQLGAPPPATSAKASQRRDAVAPGSVVTGQSTAWIPAPARLVALRDARACGAHGGMAGSAACDALLPKGAVALVWEYAPSHIDGFRAYLVRPETNQDGGAGHVDAASAGARHVAATPISTQTNRLKDGSVATLIVLEPRHGGSASECFAVTAYADGQESDMSAVICLPPSN